MQKAAPVRRVAFHAEAQGPTAYREPVRDAASKARTEQALRLADSMAAGLMIATVCFNAALAFTNAHVFGINNGVVTVVQAALVFAAVGVVAFAQPEGMGRWLVFGWATLVLVFLLMLLRSALDPKAAADVLTVPAFAALGLTMRRETLFRTLVVLQVVLVIFVVWELFWPTSFGDLLNVRSYYIATRGFTESVFYTGDSDKLFLSSQRAGGRLLSIGFNINRGSSLFLEPVTLGNWTIVVTVALTTFWKEVSRRYKITLLVTNLLLIIGCDGRLALATNLVLLASMPFAGRLPRWIPILYLPCVFALSATLLGLGVFDVAKGYDTTTGRYAMGTYLLSTLDVPGLMGLTPTADMVRADSGWTYVTLKQSILGLFALWLAVTAMVPDSEKGRRFGHAAGVFMALGLPISFSIVSIKMAATFWMLAGCTTRYVLRERKEGDAPLEGLDRAQAATTSSGRRRGLGRQVIAT